MHYPRKSLSQNYLQDKNIARKITGMLNAGNAGRVYEIGPGHGILTEFLVEKFGERLFLVEIDEDSVAWLRERFPEIRERIMAEDFLKIELQPGNDEGIAIIGNFPYHITSPIFFRILEYKDRVLEVVAMIQKEVAERLVSMPGSKTYGLLSVLLQTFYDTDYLITVPEQVFYPRPRVKSAVIRLVRNDRNELPCWEATYVSLVKRAFNQRRKTLRNALKGFLPENMVSLKILDKRAEQLSVEDFVRLCRLIGEKG
ncbi:MAG: ribosomal RNA small subunit methyltransferase A [Bacteroidales bacterium]|nr:ribosomal RNA small subunit methyltransferase A [Bacteroidales bacterium]